MYIYNVYLQAAPPNARIRPPNPGARATAIATTNGGPVTE